MVSSSIPIVIASSQPVFLYGLITMLRTEQDLEVVASCKNAETCLQAIRDLLPGLALLDGSLLDHGALRVLAAVRSEELSTRAIVLSGPGDLPGAAELVKEGAYSVLSKEVSLDALVLCLRDVHCRHGSLLAPKSLNGHGSAASGPAGDPSKVLTERECQIMQLVCEGLSNKDIGRQLKLCVGTVKVHLHHVYQKLAIQNRTALALFATGNSHKWVRSQRGADWRRFSQQQP